MEGLEHCHVYIQIIPQVYTCECYIHLFYISPNLFFYKPISFKVYQIIEFEGLYDLNSNIITKKKWDMTADQFS